MNAVTLDWIITLGLIAGLVTLIGGLIGLALLLICMIVGGVDNLLYHLRNIRK